MVVSELENVLRRAHVYFAGGRYAQARRVLLDTGSEYGNDTEWLKSLSAVEMADGRPEEAEQILAHALSLEPESAALWFNRASAALDLGQARTGLSYINTSLHFDPMDGDAHMQLARALLGLGEAVYLDQAEQAISEAARLGAHPVLVARFTAFLQVQRGDSAGARSTLVEALGVHPEDEALRLHYAMILGEDAKGHRRAGQILTAALAQHPDETSARRELLRRKHMAHLRLRYVPACALGLVGFAAMAPTPWNAGLAAAGALGSAVVWWLGERAAAGVVADDAGRDYLSAHPGLRWGRWVLLLCSLLAWAPAAALALPGGPGLVAAWGWLASVATAAVAWTAGELVRCSVLRDALDPDSPLSMQTQFASLRVSRAAVGGAGPPRLHWLVTIPVLLLLVAPVAFPGAGPALGSGLASMGLSVWVAAAAMLRGSDAWRILANRLRNRPSGAGADPAASGKIRSAQYQAAAGVVVALLVCAGAFAQGASRVAGLM